MHAPRTDAPRRYSAFRCVHSLELKYLHLGCLRQFNDEFALYWLRNQSFLETQNHHPEFVAIESFENSDIPKMLMG